MKFNSVFDIIGPVMIGPSSSHTAGAARIGKTARTLFDMEPKWINIHLYESFAKTYKGHGTDLALAGVTSRIPCDEVIGAMYRIGRTMPSALRETGEGGLAATPEGKNMKERIFGASTTAN